LKCDKKKGDVCFLKRELKKNYLNKKIAKPLEKGNPSERVARKGTDPKF
jgi:hypothetical protein